MRSLFLLFGLALMSARDLPFPYDSGPIYRETIEGRFPVEPFNTFSNLIFLIILIYWGQRVYRNVRAHTYLAWVLPVIALSLIGGLMFHGTRSAEFWLVLDWLPIMLLSLSFVFYLISKLSRKAWERALIFSALVAFSVSLRFLPIPGSLRISLGYLITALIIALPLLIYMIRTGWRHIGWVAGASGILRVAVFFRSIDLRQELLPMGTHWIWHLLGGVAVHLLITFIYKDKEVLLTLNSEE